MSENERPDPLLAFVLDRLRENDSHLTPHMRDWSQRIADDLEQRPTHRPELLGLALLWDNHPDYREEWKP